MKLVVTLTACGAAVHVGGAVEHSSAVFNVPDDCVPPLLREELEARKEPGRYTYNQIAFSLLDERPAQAGEEGSDAVDMHQQRQDQMRQQQAEHIAAELDQSAPAAGESEGKPCAWHEDDEDSGSYSTGCGKNFSFDDFASDMTWMKFCCHCGRPVDVQPWAHEDDSPAQAGEEESQ